LKREILTGILVAILVIAAGFAGYSLGTATTEKTSAVPTTPETTDVQLASQSTVICPSYLTYADQARLEKGTGLEGVDFIYVEKKTGLDAVFLMAIAKHESSERNANGVMVPGTNYWARNYNNIMSLGITAKNPDRTRYPTKTQNVLVTAQWLLRGYLVEGAPYYHGGLTQWEIGISYASDGSWARGVTDAINYYEAKLSEEQRMRRLMVKTGTFQPDVVWDYTHEVVGWSLYKIQNNKTIAGR
jgi:hypothetical protein